ncbi:hypothetical protein [Mucilaginibacter ginkgonis]|uniref:PsbP protein n=1 Tax=Mucilaginibacter ginkgonis TaxID=2682091 RepID=A0A6I4HZX8_9SPHI|nr:hypothetical protein [Mucilaginibacter ginkgonis]QQL49854.1 hypothetical protein GO620_017075 [Mucilaginibacter ginkgonis]
MNCKEGMFGVQTKRRKKAYTKNHFMKAYWKPVCLCILALATACQNNKNQSSTTDTTKQTTSNDAAAAVAGDAKIASASNFEIQIPDGWHYDQPILNGQTKFFLTAPKEMNYQTNINILKDPMKGENLDDYIKVSLAKMQSMPVTMGSSGDFTANGVSGKYLKYIYNAKERMIAVKSYVFGKNDTAYVVTATTVPELGKKYEPVFDKAVSTLKIK